MSRDFAPGDVVSARKAPSRRVVSLRRVQTVQHLGGRVRAAATVTLPALLFGAGCLLIGLGIGPASMAIIDPPYGETAGQMRLVEEFK